MAALLGVGKEEICLFAFQRSARTSLFSPIFALDFALFISLSVEGKRVGAVYTRDVLNYIYRCYSSYQCTTLLLNNNKIENSNKQNEKGAGRGWPDGWRTHVPRLPRGMKL